MSELKQTLLSDAIRFLKESSDHNTSWTVKAEQIKIITGKPLSNTSLRTPSIPSPPVPTPLFEEKRKTEVPLPIKKEKELPSEVLPIEKKTRAPPSL